MSEDAQVSEEAQEEQAQDEPTQEKEAPEEKAEKRPSVRVKIRRAARRMTPMSASMFSKSKQARA